MDTYEQKYKEALERAKEQIKECGDNEGRKEMIRNVFPELRESEDERLRKLIIDRVRSATEMTEGLRDLLLTYLEKQKEQKPEFPKPHKGDDTNPYDMSISEAQEYAIKRGFGIPFNDGEVYVDERHLTQTIGNILRWADEHPKEQKPVEKQDYSGLNDLERAIHRGFLCAGVENVSITIIKETARECLAQMNPAEWSNADMKEARNNLISVCRDWERGEQTTLLPIVAVRARYFLEHLTEPKPVEWSEEDENMLWNIISIVGQSKSIRADEMLNWLKSLRPRSSWKPSEYEDTIK